MGILFLVILICQPISKQREQLFAGKPTRNIILVDITRSILSSDKCVVVRFEVMYHLYFVMMVVDYLAFRHYS